ncbi:hypothetical protein HDV04_004712 [Boothiomyces sp. JEL0838]|nr:hypothetical protein HDV04_004712 [Boothiomyces sp. JEL0838]
MAEKNSPHYIELEITTEFLSKLIGIPVLEYTEIPVGWNNKAIKVVTKDKEYLLRLSKTTWPKEKILNEVAVLRYLQSLNVKCPRIYSYGFDKVHWILMELVQGKMLESEWRNLNNNLKRELIKQIGDQLLILQQKEFPSISGWGLKEGLPILTTYFDGNYEYSSETEYITKQLESNIKKLDTVIDTAFLKDVMFKVKQIVDRLEPVPIVLFHGDFAFRNMIISDNQLVSILDWEWAGTRPIYMDLLEDMLENENSTDETENEWIRNEFRNLGFEYPNERERKLLLDLVDATSAWRFSNVEKAKLRVIELVNKISVLP